MFSSLLSRTSAGVLSVAGLALLFLPDVLVPRLIPSYPPEGAWLAQLLAAAWLGLGMLNWFSRGALLGGIYGRPVVTANAVTFFVGAMSLLKVATRQPDSVAYWALAVPTTLLAIAYGWLLFRGPVERDFEFHAKSTPTVR